MEVSVKLEQQLGSKTINVSYRELIGCPMYVTNYSSRCQSTYSKEHFMYANQIFKSCYMPPGGLLFNSVCEPRDPCSCCVTLIVFCIVNNCAPTPLQVTWSNR